MDMDEIDALLERYLRLLHEYTTLRAELSSLQSGIYQDIARANFAAERGMRFGKDFYDDRMQATRKLEATVNAEGSLSFQVVNTQQTTAAAEPETNASDLEEEGDQVTTDDKPPAEAGTKAAKKPKKKNPLQWFGLLTPLPLRQAQGQSIKAVEEAIPRLVTVNAEMLQVEIEVRRARKRRAKAEAAAARKVEGGIAGEELTT